MALVDFGFSSTALNMAAANVFARFADALVKLRSEPDEFPGIYATNKYVSVDLIRRSNNTSETAYLTSTAGNIKTGKFELPGAEFELPIAVSGTIDRIDFFNFKGSKGDFAGAITGLRIDLAQFKKQVVDGFLTLPRDKYGAALEKAYASLFNGSDDIFGTRFHDKLFGFAGNDRMQGGVGNDLLEGGTGSDVFRGGAGSDTLRGGENRNDLDVADYIQATGRVHVSLAAGARNKEYVTGNGPAYKAGDKLVDVEGLRGSSYNDLLRGDENANTLGGWQGSDLLFGGDGKDIFVFSASAQAGDVDTIGDFDARTGSGEGVVNDRIELNYAVFTELGTKPANAKDGALWGLDRGEFYASETGTALDENTKLLYNTSNGELKYDFDGAGTGEAVLVAKLYENYGGSPLRPAQDLSGANFVIRYDMAPDF